MCVCDFAHVSKTFPFWRRQKQHYLITHHIAYIHPHKFTLALRGGLTFRSGGSGPGPGYVVFIFKLRLAWWWWSAVSVYAHRTTIRTRPSANPRGRALPLGGLCAFFPSFFCSAAASRRARNAAARLYAARARVWRNVFDERALVRARAACDRSEVSARVIPFGAHIARRVRAHVS